MESINNRSRDHRSLSIDLRSLSISNTFKEKVDLWIYKHPTTVKVAKIAAIVLAVAILATLPFSAPIIGTAGIAGLVVTALAIGVGTFVAHYAINIFSTPHHDMKTHSFKPGVCENGKLFYDGDVPVLTVESDDPYKAGKAYGYLCGDAINKVTSRFSLVLHSYLGFVKAKDVQKTMQEVKKQLPKEYLDEMAGCIDGYNEWAKEQSFFTPVHKLTVDDLLWFNLLPDSRHFNKPEAEKRLQNQDRLMNSYEDKKDESYEMDLEVGCTSLMDLDAKRELTLARNLDWAGLGVVGTYSLVINRKYTAPDKRNTVEVGIPGILGTLTGMNDKGLSLSMNVCDDYTIDINGIPACFYNRMCLESCSSVDEMDEQTNKFRPLGPYHLSVADEKKAKVYHFFQIGLRGEKGSYDRSKRVFIRKWEGNKPLITLNRTHTIFEPEDQGYNNKGRAKVLESYFKTQLKSNMEDALCLPHIDRPISLHSVVMKPKSKTFKVAFDNAFAAKNQKHTLNTDKLLAK